MRELDELLLVYLERRYDSATAEEKAAFRGLLALPDPDLVDYLLQRAQAADETTARVLTGILDRAPA